VALAREVKPDLRTFTAALDAPGWSELDVAAATAEKLGVANEPVAVDAQMMMDALPDIVWHLDDPLADPSLVPLYYLARRAAQDVTVVLSGEGADELFGGYPLYREPLSLRPISRLPSALRRGLAALARIIPEGVRGRGLLERGTTPIESRYDGGARLFTPAERLRLLHGRPVPVPDHAARPYAESAGLDDVTRMQYVDLFTWLRGDILVKADRMSMAHSLELRVPFLDPVVFEAAAGLPVDQKLSRTQTKVALRRALDGIVPADIVQRPKLGFPTPVRVWLRAEMYEWARGILASSPASELLDLAYPRELLEQHRRGPRDHSRKIWAVLVFCLWYAATEGNPRPGLSAAAAPHPG
jgi:asparagine synthase (glutamine-hydrolysing)